MRFASIPIVAAAIGVTALILFTNPTLAQSGDPKPGSQRQQATEAEGQKRVDEFAEAARQLGGPAGNPECVWLGRRAVGLLMNDDLDTAFRHMELYDRFGCPSGHIQLAFRCRVRQATPTDRKAPDNEAARIHACWINPMAEAPVPPPSAAAPATTTNR